MPSPRLECAETWAGSERTASLLELPGLVAWVHSAPAGPGDAGGDVHYLSHGLLNMVRGLDPRSAGALGLELTRALRGFRGGRAPADDETIIVLQRVAAATR